MEKWIAFAIFLLACLFLLGLVFKRPSLGIFLARLFVRFRRAATFLLFWLVLYLVFGLAALFNFGWDFIKVTAAFVLVIGLMMGVSDWYEFKGDPSFISLCRPDAEISSHPI